MHICKKITKRVKNRNIQGASETKNPGALKMFSNLCFYLNFLKTSQTIQRREGFYKNIFNELVLLGRTTYKRSRKHCVAFIKAKLYSFILFKINFEEPPTLQASRHMNV